VRQKPFTVYIVDDDHCIRKALERLLKSVGYRAVTFASAEALLEFPLGRDEGCLILDIHLPGMNGFELQEALSSRGSAYPVLFMTAHENPRWRERAQTAGAVAYLKKPFTEASLLEAIGLCCETGPFNSA
jgi:FixJ family two-component response regulator